MPTNQTAATAAAAAPAPLSATMRKVRWVHRDYQVQVLWLESKRRLEPKRLISESVGKVRGRTNVQKVRYSWYSTRNNWMHEA